MRRRCRSTWFSWRCDQPRGHGGPRHSCYEPEFDYVWSWPVNRRFEGWLSRGR